MDPPPVNTSVADSLLGITEQLAQVTAMLRQQQMTIAGLQHAVYNQEDNASGPSIPEGAVQGQGADPAPPEERAPGGQQSQTAGATTLQAGESSAAQHGIRASELWKSTTALSKEAFKPAFKLEGAKEYAVWRFSMLKFLQREGLESFALGTALKPPFPVSGDAEESRLYYRWLEFNIACETAILASLGKSQLGLLTRCNSATEMWYRLQSLYMHSSETNIAKLEDDLHNVKWKRNTSLESYLQDIDRIVDSLRGCGQDVPESRLRQTLLHGLPSRLENIKHILLSLGPKPYYVLCDHLRSHIGLSAADDPKAFIGEGPSEKPAATTEKKKQKPKAQAKEGSGSAGNKKSCTFCKLDGHTTDACRKKKKAEVVCHTCKQKGHYASECKSKEEAREEESDATMMVRYIEPEPSTKALSVRQVTGRTPAALLVNAEGKDEWIVDSGATKHMSNAIRTFNKDSERYVKQEVYLGDSSSVPVTTRGDITLRFNLEGGKSNLVTMKDVLGVPGLSKNLISVSACMKNGYSVLFDHNFHHCRIFNEKRTWGLAQEKGGLWVLDCDPATHGDWANTARSAQAKKQPPAKVQRMLKQWHSRFGHLSYDNLKKLAARGMVDWLDFKNAGNFDYGC